MMICIAGKNDIAIKSLEYLTHKYSVDILSALPVKRDNGKDGPFLSYRRKAKAFGVKVVHDISELYSIPGLVFISLEYDQIIDTNRFISQSLFNIHFSLLPKYKGVYTSAWHILNNEPEAGVTLHLIDNGIDTGPIIDQLSFRLNPNMTCRELYFSFNKYGFMLFKKNLNLLVDGTFEVTPQPAFGASYYSRKSINYNDIKVDINKTAFEIDCQIRAFYFPEFQVPNIYGYDIKSSKILNKRSSNEPGTLIDNRDDYLILSTIDYDIMLFKAKNERI